MIYKEEQGIMSNALSDLNNILFEQVQRLSNGENVKPEKLKAEIERAKAIGDLSKTIIDNARLQLEAVMFSEQANMATGLLPDVLQNKNDKACLQVSDRRYLT